VLDELGITLYHDLVLLNGSTQRREEFLIICLDSSVPAQDVLTNLLLRRVLHQIVLNDPHFVVQNQLDAILSGDLTGQLEIVIDALDDRLEVRLSHVNIREMLESLLCPVAFTCIDVFKFLDPCLTEFEHFLKLE
jgi:hypothetical protein